MATRFELLSPNLVKIIEGLVRNEELGQLLFYNTDNPLSQPPVNPSRIAPFGDNEKVAPFPFNTKFTGEQISQIHVYYPDVTLKNNEHVEESIVWFDIVVHKKLWLYTQDNNKLVRPYEIASRIDSQFDGTISNTKTTVGELNFMNVGHVVVNDEFNALRLQAKMTTY